MAIARAAEAATGRVLDRAARGMAYGGGAALLGIALVTVASVTGRALSGLGLGPVTGDYELVEAGCAIAVFSFLPLCQLRRGHVTVDVLIQRFPPRARAAFGLLGDTLITLTAGVILWRLWLGFGERFPYGGDALRAALSMGDRPFFAETTYDLQLPVWIPYALSLGGAAAFLVVSLYTMWRGLNWTLDGEEGRP
ncbi:TRAP transporter small permease [Actibacterium sp. MT2.3-13A]|uniref:TRAP transporter small permease n=1 Tax=Actibacterium sp. MT2.3-13A TaxID=2828332 RepID=UPI001BA91CBD|nr:TRAP transporter small permease [Actibacterium sp. MT2.3-13A]